MDKRFIIIFVIAMIGLYLVLGDCKTCKRQSSPNSEIEVNEGFSGCSCNSGNGEYRVYKKPNYYGFGPWNWKYHYGEPYYIKFTNQ